MTNDSSMIYLVNYRLIKGKSLDLLAFDVLGQLNDFTIVTYNY